MMKLKWDKWFYALGQTVVGGVAAAGSAWLGTLVGSQVTAEIKPLDWKQFGIVILASALLNLFFFLKQSPLPAESTGNTEVITKDASRLSLWLLCGFLSFGLVGLPGCTAPAQRVAFNSIASVQTVTVGAYDGYVAEIIAGRVRTNHLPAVSRKFNVFQAATLVALDAVEYNTNALAPPQLTKVSADLLNLINQAAKEKLK